MGLRTLLIEFNGQIYGCQNDGCLYVLDHTKAELIQLIPGDTIGHHGKVYSRKRLVVWDGVLYFVLVYAEVNPPPPECYKLVEAEGNCRWERVEDLGDGVLFITKDCLFSMSARDLPPPWRGNSIVFFVGARMMCVCVKWKIQVFELGVEGAQYTTISSSDGVVPISSFQGYSDLFAPPLTHSD